jgi:hypothetical protein
MSLRTLRRFMTRGRPPGWARESRGSWLAHVRSLRSLRSLRSPGETTEHMWGFVAAPESPCGAANPLSRSPFSSILSLGTPWTWSWSLYTKPTLR